MSVAPGGPPAATAAEVVAVAFCPCPPLLLPAVEGAPTEETTTLRAACDAAVRRMLDARPDQVLLVGPDVPAGARYGPGDVGDLRGYGVDLTVPFAGPAGADAQRVPTALTIGAWLLDRAGHTGPRAGLGPDRVAAALTGRVGVLVMGDGSARRGLKAPGYLDDAAGPFDAAVAAALAAGDASALGALDLAEGERLLAAGAPAWRAVGAALTGQRFAAQLRYDDAPFGVGYMVADWVAS